MTLGDRVVVMKDGVVQQCGEPLELYNSPANRFVAGFIGSPTMNFHEVGVERSGDTVTLKADGVDIPLPSRYRGALAEHKGDRIIAGVRPEHLDVRAEGAAGTLTGKADVVEYLGNEELIHVGVGAYDVVALIDSANRVRPGDELTLRIGLDKVHLFDPDTTLALDKEREAASAGVSAPTTAAEESVPQATAV
jgi:multiple sugar transport system ATP-binding protein